MNNIHIVMMGKGGVGKSTTSVILAQYLASNDADLRCADLDPTNATFNAFNALNAEHINIADDDFNIYPAEFDRLMEKILTEKCNWVVDTGAATFLPLMNYFIKNEVFSFLLELERRVIIHTPLVGGPAMDETIRGLKSILELCDVPVVVWENEFFGPVSRNGRSFIQSPGYEQFKSRVLGVVRLEKGDPKQSEKDMMAMNTRRLTWDEALVDPNFMLMQRQRLTKMRREIDKQLNAIEF
jgi:hypothetical protein